MRDPLPPPYVPASLDFGDDSPGAGAKVAVPRAAPAVAGPIKDGKLYRTGIKRDANLMYYIKAGDIWATPRKQPGKPFGKAVKLTSIGFEMDYTKYLYYVDLDGDIAVKSRQVGGR